MINNFFSINHTFPWHSGVRKDLVRNPRPTSSASGASFGSDIPNSSELFSGMFSRESHYTRSLRAGSSINDLSSYLLGFPNTGGLGPDYVPPWSATSTNKSTLLDDDTLFSITRATTPSSLYHGPCFRGLNGYLTLPRGKPNVSYFRTVHLYLFKWVVLLSPCDVSVSELLEKVGWSLSPILWLIPPMK